MLKGLIVDDAKVMRLRLRDILDKRFVIVAEAEDGEQAIDLYEQHHPDFVTLDITMQKMNGMQALKSLLDKHPDAKIVMVSAVGQKQMVFQALSLGARDFIVKPFEPDRVIQAVERLFQ